MSRRALCTKYQPDAPTKVPVSDFKTMLSFLSSKTRPPWCCEKYEKTSPEDKSQTHRTLGGTVAIPQSRTVTDSLPATRINIREGISAFPYSSPSTVSTCFAEGGGKPPVLPLLSLFLPTPEAGFPLLLLSVPRPHPAEMEGPSLLLFFENLFNSKIPLQLPMTHRLCL